MSEVSLFFKNKWENWRYLKAFPTKRFTVWVWIRTWTFLTLAVQRFNSCKYLKGQLFIKYFSNYSKCILIKFLCKSSKVLNTHPLPPQLTIPNNLNTENFCWHFETSDYLRTECVGVVLGKRQARKKTSAEKFSWDWSFPVSSRVCSKKKSVCSL